MEKQIKCPTCKGNRIIKWCKRKTQNRGNIQRYKCKSCNKYFTIDDGFFRMRNTPQKISQGIDLFYRGVSTRKVQEHLAIFHPHNASNVSIYNWVVKYAKMISNFTDNLKLNCGSEAMIDEMEYKRRKDNHKRGTATNWFIDSIDTKTRFMLSSAFADKRDNNAIKEVVKGMRYKTENQIKKITTDGFNVYDEIVKRYYGYNRYSRDHQIEHHKVIASNGEGFNHKIERLHNSIRERTKTFRGFHGSINSAKAIMQGYTIFYNFIRKHQAINCCPYELALPNLRLNDNKWLDLIYASKEQKV